VAKPEWWNDEGLKALSAIVVRALPNNEPTITMRAIVLSGMSSAWLAGPRSAAELEEAAAHFERSAPLTNAPAVIAEKTHLADACRTEAAQIRASTRVGWLSPHRTRRNRQGWTTRLRNEASRSRLRPPQTPPVSPWLRQSPQLSPPQLSLPSQPLCSPPPR